MFNNISNPKWFGDWSRLEDEYLDNNFTEIQDNFAFSKRKKTNGLFGAIVSLATAFPVRDPETGHATGAWKVACESIDLDEVPLSDIADMISCFGSKTITDFHLYNRKVDITPWQQALGELLERPVVLMDSDRDDTMVAVLADVDGDGLPLIAALRPGANAVSGGRCVPGTIVCSVYGKPESYFLHKMQQMPQRVLYQDIEKGRELDARAKLQLFGGNIASPDLDRKIIRLPECIVKLRADTPQMETHGRETSRVRQESRDMASGRAALDAGRRAETARVTERHIDSNLK